MTNAALPSTEVPAGYRKNAKGHLVPEHLIGPVDLMTDDLVNEIAHDWKLMHEELTSFKRVTFGEVHALIATINDEYKVKRGGEKGNVQFFNYDGRYKLVVAVNETIAPGPELQAAQEKINECLDNWTDDARPELKSIINEAFATDGQGGIRISRILQIRRYKIQSEDWQMAMKALDEALRVVGSKQYLRLYERNQAGAYLPIPLDIAAL